MLVTTILPRLAASASTESIRDASPVPIVSTTTSHIRPQVTSQTRSNAAAPQPVRQAASGRSDGSTAMTDASLTTVCRA